jgi:peptidoglycan/LPS O-acetylase OafA/YrhL
MGYIRFLLATSVMLAHLNAPIVICGFGGANSVEAFFFISGFLIASILNKTYHSRRNFYLNRFLRIFPMYWLVLTVTLIFRSIDSKIDGISPDVDFNLSNQFQLLFLILLNILILGSDLLVFLRVNSDGMFDFIGFRNTNVTGTEYLLVSPIWSVSLELVFYIFAPFLIKRTTRTLSLVIVVLLFARSVIHLLGVNEDPWTYRFFPFELPIFLLGILLFRFSDSTRKRYSEIKLLDHLTRPLFIILIYAGFGFYRSQVTSPRPIELFFTLLFVSLILLFAKNSKWSNLVGSYSYPIYIVHYPTIYFLERYQEVFYTYFGSTQIGWIGCQIFIVMSLSYLLIEITKPIEKMRERLRF